MRVLLVKLSSMGDVLHNLPVVSDLVHAYPDVEIDWVTEAPYAPLVRLHPGVCNAIPLQLRSLKKNWWSPAAWCAFLDSKKRLADQTYDMVLDTQGLLKSAFVARCAKGPIVGFSRASAREPLAARFYNQEIEVLRDLHAVKRNRQLAAGAFGYALRDVVEYGLRFRAFPADFVRPFSQGKYAVFLHATSRANKMWPESHWIELGMRLHEIGIGVVLPWGSADERRVSERLADGIPGAIIPTVMSLLHAAALLAEASVVIGVDTGLAHLAVALARPSVGLYVTTSPALTGLYGSSLAVNLGGGSPAQPTVPGVDETWVTVKSLLGQQ